jgi:SAM-dependent methyltransferase
MAAGNLRELLAAQYLKGSGLEIGALYNPLFVPADVSVRYVDAWDEVSLRSQLQAAPELKDAPIVAVDMVDNGETLAQAPDGSQDFIIANHFLEHTQDPLGVLRRHLQVLRPKGVLYLAIPDKRWTFDASREVTPLAHLYRDHDEGPAWSFQEHVREWVEHVEKKTGPVAESRVAELLHQPNLSIHFHVWTQNELLEMFVDARRRLSLPYEVIAVVLNAQLCETICILRKT